MDSPKLKHPSEFSAPLTWVPIVYNSYLSNDDLFRKIRAEYGKFLIEQGNKCLSQTQIEAYLEGNYNLSNRMSTDPTLVDISKRYIETFANGDSSIYIVEVPNILVDYIEWDVDWEGCCDIRISTPSYVQSEVMKLNIDDPNLKQKVTFLQSIVNMNLEVRH